MQHWEWPDGVFDVAQARDAGATAGALRSRRLHKPAYGVRSVAPVRSLADRCAALLHRLNSDAFVCGPTAALLWGAPLPREWERRDVVDIGVPAPARAPHASGIAGRSLTVDPQDIVVGRRGRLTSPERTWCDLGAVLDLPDLVAVGDFLLHVQLVETATLRSAVERYPSRRGLASLRSALVLLDGRAESRPETQVRVALVLAGIRGIEANVDIFDDSGQFLGRVDLCIAWARVIVEYHGDYHRVERGRWRRDRARIGRLRAAGWSVIELTGDDLRDLDAVVALVRAELAR